MSALISQSEAACVFISLTRPARIQLAVRKPGLVDDRLHLLSVYGKRQRDVTR